MKNIELTSEQVQEICELIEKSLNSVTLKNVKNTDGTYHQLLDLLSFGDTIESGKEEITHIVEQIFFDISDKYEV